MKKILLFLLLLVSLGIAFYNRGDFIRLYNDTTTQIQNFDDTDLGSILNEVGRQILAPTPLNIGGVDKNVVLVKSKIILETNLQRQKNGDMPALKENTFLDQAAAAKASDMFDRQYFEHKSPTGVDPGKLVNNYGYDYILAGENLILGNFASEKEVVQNWMDSPGHRENILNNRYTEIGVAIIKGTYKGESVWIGVQEFGFPLSTCDQPDSNLMSQIDFEKAHLDSLSIQLDEKKKQFQNTDPKSPAYNQMADDYNQLVISYNLLADQVKLKIADYNSQVSIFNACVVGD